MPYHYKRRIRLRRKPRYYRRKRNVIKFGQKHIKVSENLAVDLAPTAGTNFHMVQLSDISVGDLLNQRNTDKVWSRGMFLRMMVRNEHTTPRYVRMALLTLSGSTQTADVTNWTDIFTTATYSKTTFNGHSNDVIYRINQDEYKVLGDYTYRVGAANDGVSTLSISRYFKISKLIRYNYNSTNERKNPLYFIFWTCESEGVTANAAHTSIGYSISHYYTDVDGFTGYAMRPKKVWMSAPTVKLHRR